MFASRILCNYLLHSHTDHDDDNNYDRKEEPNYTSYKEGAQAGMSFIKRSDKEKDQHANP